MLTTPIPYVPHTTFLTRSCQLDAIDAALVRVMKAGGIEKTAVANPGYEALVVHSCQLNPDLFPWPPASALGSRTKIKIAAL